jgi:23S rRNA pseudouridine1911/1915/1917 synthase
VLSRFSNGLSLLQCQLETGRTHQIRVHVTEWGFPIVGDHLYGGLNRIKNLKSVQLRRLIKNMTRFALHAAELGFVHPRTSISMNFSSSWPEDLQFLIPESEKKFTLHPSSEPC